VSGSSAHLGTVHVVAVPTTGTHVHNDLGRLAPPLLLGESLRAGRVPRGRVVVVGPTGAAETARACGLSPDCFLTLPVGRPALGRRGFRRVAAGVQRIICWSDELSPLVRRMADEVHLVSTDPDRCPAPPRHFARVTVLTEEDERVWRGRGGSPVLEADSAEHAPAGSLSPADRRADLPVDASMLTLASLDDRPASTDARGLAFLLSVLHTTGYPVCGLVPSIAGNAFVARRHIRGLTSRYPLLLTERPLIALLRSIDIVITSDESKTGANAVLESVARAHGVRVIRLSHKGRAGLKSTPGAAAPILQTLDAILADRRDAPTLEPQHA
jgi:hypothetical protein